LNTSHQPRRLDIAGTANLLLSTDLDRDSETIRGATMLRADEGIILALDA